MNEMKSAEFQKSQGADFLKMLASKDEVGYVVALNGPGGEVMRRVKISPLADNYDGEFISCRELKASGVSGMLRAINQGKEVMRARMGGYKFFKMEVA